MLYIGISKNDLYMTEIRKYCTKHCHYCHRFVDLTDLPDLCETCGGNFDVCDFHKDKTVCDHGSREENPLDIPEEHPIIEILEKCRWMHGDNIDITKDVVSLNIGYMNSLIKSMNLRVVLRKPTIYTFLICLVSV